MLQKIFCVLLLTFSFLLLSISEVSAQQIYQPRVLVVALDPMENGQSVVTRFFSAFIGGNTMQQRRIFEDATVAGYARDLAEYTQQQVQYQIAHKVEIQTFPPFLDGSRHTFASYEKCTQGDIDRNCETQKWNVDYVSFIEENDLCAVASAHDIDEIWILSTSFVLTYEAFMIGPSSGFGVNGPSYTIPGCEKHYVVMNPTYESANNFFHNYGHRVEDTFRGLTMYWSSTDRTKHWENFARVSRYAEAYNTTIIPKYTYCGNTHFPHNAEKHYDTANVRFANSSCGDWQNFPNYTNQVESINCQKWGCDPKKWYLHWLTQFPNRQNAATLTNVAGNKFYFSKNWWDYIVRPELTIDCNKNQANCARHLVPLSADLTGDDFVDVSDYSVLVGEFLRSQPVYISDLNLDFIVDLSDYSIMVNQFFQEK